jgi:Ring finger domain
MITVLLLIVIIGGAIKARRHPERYGPRRGLTGRPRQSRAKGIAIAMLETLPIVKFGDPDPKDPNSTKADPEIEMAQRTSHPPTTREPKSEEQRATEAALDGSGNSSTPPRPTSALSRTVEDLSSSRNHLPDASLAAAAPGTPAPDTTPVADNSISCSICTEDFTLGEELRVLPCNHKFHALCVDPWLLNVSGTCPLCRIDLRPPQEIADEQNADEAANAVSYRTMSVVPRRRMSTMGGMMRGTRALDVQGIVEASRDERIRILRRWREERERRRPDDDGTRSPGGQRGRRFSTWLRDGFAVRGNDEVHPAQDGVNASPDANEQRPRTWYGGAPIFEETTPQLPPLLNETPGASERARTWYGDLEAGHGAIPEGQRSGSRPAPGTGTDGAGSSGR